MALSPLEYQPCPLQYHDFRQLDHLKNCTIYSRLLEKQDGVNVNELENLHADIIILKESVQQHIQLLTSEMAVLNDWQVKREYGGKKRKHSDTGDATTPLPVPGRPSKSHHHISPPQDPILPIPKRPKTTAVIPTAVHEDHVSSGVMKSSKRKGGKSKAGPSDIPSEDSTHVHTMDVTNLLKPKSEVTDKFWSTVEPYCADITENDFRMLQDFGSPKDSNLFEIPSLGVHYARQWGLEDIKEEASRIQGHVMTKTWQHNEAESLLNDGISQNKSNLQSSSCGPLTQKFMSAFLNNPLGSNIGSHNQKISTSLPPLSPSVLEARLKEELVALGLLEPNEQQKDTSDEDEILQELKKAQVELRTVSEYNQQQKHMLQSLARAEMRRQDIRKKLQETDSELMELLRRFASYRQRKKREPLSRKDKESAQKVLETRQRLIQQLLV